MHVSKVRVENKIMEEAKWDAFRSELRRSLQKEGFDYGVDEKAPRQSFNFSGVRLSGDWVKIHGYNISPYTGRRGKVLGWNDWVRFNNTVNKVMNKYNISAKVSSLGGKFKIREGMTAMTEKDWEGLGEENVGSIVEPVKRRDAWVSER